MRCYSPSGRRPRVISSAPCPATTAAPASSQARQQSRLSRSSSQPTPSEHQQQQPPHQRRCRRGVTTWPRSPTRCVRACMRVARHTGLAPPWLVPPGSAHASSAQGALGGTGEDSGGDWTHLTLIHFSTTHTGWATTHGPGGRGAAAGEWEQQFQQRWERQGGGQAEREGPRAPPQL